ATAGVGGADLRQHAQSFGAAKSVKCFEQLQSGGRVQVPEAMNMRVPACREHGHLPGLCRHASTPAARIGQWHTGSFVAMMGWPFGLWRLHLAEIVTQGGVARGQRRIESCACRQYQQRMHTAIDFRMVSDRLRYTEQGVEFRKQSRQCATGTQQMKKQM